MELNLVVGGINAAAITPSMRDGARGRGRGRQSGGERRQNGDRYARDKQRDAGEKKADVKKDEIAKDGQEAEKEPNGAAVGSSAEFVAEKPKQDIVNVRPPEKPKAEPVAPKVEENRPSFADLQKLKAPPKVTTSSQKKGGNSNKSTSVKAPAFEIEYDLVPSSSSSSTSAASDLKTNSVAEANPRAGNQNNSNNDQKKNKNGNESQQQRSNLSKAKGDGVNDVKVEAPQIPTNGQQQQAKKNQKQGGGVKKEPEEKSSENGTVSKDELVVDLPSPLSENLVAGQQTLIEVNGALYLKLDAKKADAEWLKKVRENFSKGKLVANSSSLSNSKK